MKKSVLKRLLFTGLLSFFVASFVSSQSRNLEAYWDDGLKFQSNDGLYRFSVGGRVHYDVAFSDHTGALDTLFTKNQDRVEVRRARLSFEGSINKAFAYEFEFTFGETLQFADMYFAFMRAPFFDRITVGHFREPFGMEELTSSNAIVFMERSLTSAFGPSRNTGVMLQKQFMDRKLQSYAGFFRITDDLGSDLAGEGRHSFSGRMAYNPVLDTGTNTAVHFGMAVNTFTPNSYTYQVKTENEVHSSPAYINTGKLENTKRVKQIGGEFGYTKNKLLVQAEYIHAFARQAATDDTPVSDRVKDFNSYYVMASYFLKGGTRKYNRSGNRFSSISLKERYEKGSMSGAWEVGLRLSQIDIGEVETPVRKMSNVTLGLNWYFNSNSRIMMNYVLTKMSKDFAANTVQARIQLTF